MPNLTVTFHTKEVKLTDKNYSGEGGEGVIYIKDNLVFKIYHKQSDVISAQKLAELSVLTLDNIVAPMDFVYDPKGTPIGYAMKFIDDTESLVKLITSSFRNRNNISSDMATKLIEKMASTIHFIHQKGILLVDGNEFNYLVDKASFIIPYFIDVDSYQTKTSPAKVIMPSIRDWQSKDFNEMTDWYSFAIVAAQVFVGTHPFKGSHSSFTKNDMKARQLANVSIFNKDVSLPPATRDFSCIPSEYMNWFLDVFEKGQRKAPPAIAGKLISKPQLVIIATGKDHFVIDEVFKAIGPITGCVWAAGNRTIFTDKELYFNQHNHGVPSKTAGVVYFENTPYLVDIRNGFLEIQHGNSRAILCGEKIQPVKATKKLIVENRAYIINDDKFSEIKFRSISGRIFITVGNTWDILPKSTHVFREMLYSDVLGKPFLYIPFKENSCSILQVPELTKHKIIDAKYENGICMLLTFKDNVYHRATVKFKDDFATYFFEIEDDVIPFGINFVALPNNIYMLYNGEGEIVIGSRFKPEKKIISNIKFDHDISLCHNGLEVHYYSEDKLYRIKTR